MKSKLITYQNKLECFLLIHRKFMSLFTIFICTLLLISRRPDAILNPQFWAEDGKTWYADAYNYGLSSVVSTYAGYIVLPYRLVGYISLVLPLGFVPLFFNAIALGIQLIPITLLNSSLVEKFITKRTVVLWFSFIYVALPNAAEVYLNLTNIQWPLGLAAFIVLFAEEKSKLWSAYCIIILILTGLSGPLLMLLWPIALYLCKLQKSRRNLRNFAIITVLSLAQLLSIILSDFDRLGSHVLGTPIDLIKMFVGQIMTGGLLGERNVGLAYDHFALLACLMLIGLCITGYAFINGPRVLKAFIAYSILIIGSMLFSLKSVNGFDIWKGLTNPSGGQRYWYIPIMAWLAILSWCAFRASNIYVRWLCAVTLLLLVIGIPSDWRLRQRPNLNFQNHVKAFTQLESGNSYTFPINPSWQMILKKR